MADEQGQTAAPQAPSPEELQRKLEQLELQNRELSSSVTRLSAKRDELLNETKKRKNLDRLLQAVNIDIEDEEAEDQLAKRIAAALSRSDDSDGAPASVPAQQGSQAPVATPPVVPSTTAQDLEMKGQLKALQKKLAAMEKEAEAARQREQEAVEKRKRDFVELRVKEGLQKAGCINPNHFFIIKGNMFRLSDDGETVIGGAEHDPRSLEDQIEAFKDDQEFAMYFRGTGASGSGMAKGQGGFGGQSLKNPFRTDQLNVTQASEIYTKDPEKAKRLILEARSAGKLDPRLGQLAGI
jgi:hypothetical protein